jgi:predicted metal-dependent hydrolase
MGMDEPALAELAKGIREFNDGAFFEAHDTLEDLWMDVRGENRLFIQGLIQVSIGCYHLTCENYSGADHLLTRGVEKLETYPAHQCGVNVGQFLEEVRTTLQAVKQTREGERPVSFWTFPKIQDVLGSQPPVDSGS